MIRSTRLLAVSLIAQALSDHPTNAEALDGELDLATSGEVLALCGSLLATIMVLADDSQCREELRRAAVQRQRRWASERN